MLRNIVCAALRTGENLPQKSLSSVANRYFSDQGGFDGATQKLERMEKSMNQVTLLGRVGADPEKRGTEQHPVVTFSIATHTNYKKGDDIMQQTDWHRVAVFKPYLRETIYRYLVKGQRVLVQGRLGYLERRDPENNALVMKTASIVADDVVFFNK